MNESLVLGQEVWFFICFHTDQNEAVHLEDFYLCKGRIKSIRTFLSQSTEYTLEDIDGDDLIYKAHETEIYLSYDEAIEHLLERVKK